MEIIPFEYESKQVRVIQDEDGKPTAGFMAINIGTGLKYWFRTGAIFYSNHATRTNIANQR